MSQAIADHRLVLSDGHTDPDTGILHAASPFMIGLVGAVLGMALIAPDLLRNGPLIASALLIPSMLVSVGIYAWSVVNPGDIVGLIVDRKARTLELVQANAFAMRRSRIAFGDIARIGLEASYDRDGYGSRVAVLTLVTGERLPLAFAADQARVTELKAVIGHVSPKA